ncbi:MAG: sugar-binding domain-containing protein, partial [Anaerohalosphaeraceae bacterium]
MSTLFLSSFAVSDNRIDLSGPWRLRLDPGNTGIKNQWFNEPLDDQVQLPGTLDTNQKGTPTAVEPELKIENLKHLTRKYEYTGPAWYQRQIHIPKDWEDQQVFLTLERIIWESTV